MKGLEYNETNLKTILNDDDAMFEVVKKGAARGLTIGAIEFITQGLAGKGVGVAKKAVGRGRVGNLAGVATAIGVEAVGGGVGEIAGSAAAGQDITGSDVVMESIGGTATAPISVLKGLASAPKYTQRGKKISGRMAQRLVDTATPEQLADMGLEIKNDPELSNTLDLKRSPVIARRKARSANSDLLNRLSEKDGDNLIDLTIELEEQRKSKSPLGKKRVTELEAQIEEIVNNAPKEPETPDVSAEDSSGSEAPAPAKNTSTKKVVDNNSKPTASQNSEGERLSQYDESQDGLDGAVEDSANKSGYYTNRVKQGELKINSLNKRISAILTQVQNALAPDGGIGGATALNEEQRQEYRSLLKERNSLEKQLSKDRASERAAKKASRPTISIDAEEKSNFVEVDSQNPDAGLSNPNMPTEFRSLLSNVLNKAVAKFRDKLPQVSIKVHRDIGSFNIAMRGADGSAMSKDNVTFGWYDSKKKQIHMLDVTNPEVRSAIKGFGEFNMDSVTDLVTEEVLFHFAMESMLSDSKVRSRFLNQLLDLALNNYRLRGVLSDRMFAYFPDGVKGMVKAAEGMPKLIRSIEDVYIRNGEFTVSDIKALLAFVTDSKKKANIEEELIGGYVRDYIKSPDSYRNVWQKIADIINRLIGKNIINSEADLKGFARVLSRGIEGEEVQFTPGESQSESPISKSTRSKREFTYLKDTEVFYTFDRQSGRESDWVFTNSRGKSGTPQSIKVNDYFHFRNWYNKITANQKYPGIATEMYFIKDGKKHIVKPPKPQVDKNGKKVQIKRIPTFKELKGAARMRDQAADTEMRVQYSKLSKEVSNLWHNSGLNVYTTLQSFYPDGESSTELDFEGLVIAKKNIQAAIDSGITKEQLKDLAGNRGSISKEDNPDLFNMSGLVRFNEAGSGDAIADGEVKFSTQIQRGKFKAPEGHMRHFTKGRKKNVGSAEELNGVRGVQLGFDSTWIEEEKKNPSGIKKQNEIRLTARGTEEALKGNRIITSHLTVEDAGIIERVLERQAAMDAISKGLKPGERGQVAITFNNLGDGAIAGNPYVASKIALDVKNKLNSQVESGETREETAVELINSIMNQSSARMGFTNVPGGERLISQLFDVNEGELGAEQIEGPGRPSFSYEWNLKTIDDVNKVLDSLITGDLKNPFSGPKKDFVNRISSLIKDGMTALSYASEKNLLDPYLTQKTSGHLIAYRMIPYTVSEREKKKEEKIKTEVKQSVVNPRPTVNRFSTYGS